MSTLAIFARLRPMRPFRLLPILAVAILALGVMKEARTQNAKQVYAQIGQRSPIHWCLAQAGDDPAGIIGKQCAVYSECLGALNLQDDVDRPPFTGLSEVQVNWVRRCHQELDSAARANPQIKGAGATEDWLEHHVYPGTEAKAGASPPGLR